jgi:hypothetical protein
MWLISRIIIMFVGEVSVLLYFSLSLRAQYLLIFSLSLRSIYCTLVFPCAVFIVL